MSLYLMAFLDHCARLAELARRLRDELPAGATVEIRTLDQRLVRLDYPAGGTPAPTVRWPAVAMARLPETTPGRAGALVARLDLLASHGPACLLDGVLHFEDTQRGAPYAHMVGFLQRRADISRADFARHWRGVHAPLALSLTPVFDRYRTHVVVETHGDFEWDGIVFQEFGSPERLRQHASPDRLRTPRVTEDNEQFMAAMELHGGTGVVRP